MCLFKPNALEVEDSLQYTFNKLIKTKSKQVQENFM